MKFRNTSIKYLKKVKLTFIVKSWLMTQKLRGIINYMSKHFPLIRRILIISFAFILGYIIANHIDEINTKIILSNYLITAGAMVGGIIAVVFTLSIFLLQNAAEFYSSQYFEVYINDWRDKTIFPMVVIIAILFLGGGIYVSGIKDVSTNLLFLIIFYSMGLIGFVFALIDWQFHIVKQKINPIRAI